MTATRPDGARHQTAGTGRTLSLDEALDFGCRQVRTLIESAPGRLTTYTSGGKWVFDKDPWAPTWSGGFLTGMLWIFAARTGDPWWHQRAREYSLLLEDRKPA